MMGFRLAVVVVVAAMLLAASGAAAGPGCGCGMKASGGPGCPSCCGGNGPCAGSRPGSGGRRMGPSRDAAMQADHDTFLFLLDHRAQIQRKVTELPDGVETLTESADPQVAEKIRAHVQAMKARMSEGRPIHARDPLFAELFRHGDAMSMAIEPTDRGARVRETSRDAYVVKLIKAHADVVSRFLANGHAEMRKNHNPPPR